MKSGCLKSFASGLVALASVLCAERALATDVSGTLSSDTVWSAAGSPYVVTGTVLVSSGVKLTLEAGVEVKFDSGKSLQVFGELVAKGTSGSSITFTSVQESKAAGDWGQIVLYDSSVDASYDGNGDYASGSILEYCTVEYGGGIQLKLANPFINQGTIRYHSGRGIGTDNYNSSDNSATLKITNNTISNNAGGVYLYGLGTVLISGNTISNNNITAMPCSTPKLIQPWGNMNHDPSDTSTAQPATCAQRRQKRRALCPASTAKAWPPPAQNRKRLTMQVRCHVQTGSR